MRKLIGSLIALCMLFALLSTPMPAEASTIKIMVDGSQLMTDQPPITENGRVLVPLRGIFEKLDATVVWIPNERKIIATKDSTTVTLTVGSRTATINNQTVTLDTPAKVVNGRTLVPIRFISEALGEEVDWHESTRTVVITTAASKAVGAATNIRVSASGNYGDGRDLHISFTPPATTVNVQSYRVMVVKEKDASSFNLTKAQSVPSDRYTTFPVSYTGQTTSLASQARDVDGDRIQFNQSYRVFVLTVGSRNDALSAASSTVTLEDPFLIGAATNVEIKDVADFGDGRDLHVSFTKPSNENNIAHYRVMIVRTSEANRFDLQAANAVSSNNYTTVSRSSGRTLSVTLDETARDVSGQRIRNDVAYTAFVLSVTNNNRYKNNLSNASNSVTLQTSPLTPRITSVADVGDYGDGRDLQISFNRASDESRIREYRVFVVREDEYSRFNLLEADKVPYGRYTDVAKTGRNLTITLPARAKDIHGHDIVDGVAYRVFVMGVSNSSAYQHALSAPSNSITLQSVVPAVTNVQASDVSDFGNGRDLQVTFNTPRDDSNIDHYRILVVKEVSANRFSLANANAVASRNYTTVRKSNSSSITATLAADARDVDGDLIQNGINYRVFVLSVSRSNNQNNNALSNASGIVTLVNNSVSAVTNVSATVAGNTGTGQDLQVSFTRPASENGINHYRVYVVKTSSPNQFNVNLALSSNNYTSVPVGSSSVTLSANALDVDGDLIKDGVSYRVFVLSVGNNQANSVLSTASNEITLTTAESQENPDGE